jgi:hypothetical protein
VVLNVIPAERPVSIGITKIDNREPKTKIITSRAVPVEKSFKGVIL